MKLKGVSKLVLIILICSISFGSAQTKTPNIDPKAKEAIKELLLELKKYATDNIFPKLTDWKGTLDKAMTTDDLTQLNTLRADAKKLQIENRQTMFALRRVLTNKTTDSIEYYKAALKDIKVKQKTLLTDLKPIAIKYKSTLEQIGGLSKDFAPTWKKDIKETVKTWFVKNKENLGGLGKAFIEKQIKKANIFQLLDPEKKNKLVEFKKKLMAAKFMLWDGTIPEFGNAFQPQNNTTGNNINPEGYILNQNYPNPFNPTTTISFSIPKETFVTLKVFDALGKEVATLINDNLNSGQHQVTFNANNLSSGNYFYQITADNFVQKKQMQLIK